MTQKIEFKNTLDEKLAGALHQPEQYAGDLCVIVCHGFTGNKDKNWIKNACDRISKEVSVPAFRFDFAGNGESEGTFAQAHYLKEVGDLKSAIDLLETKGFKKFITIGHSMGSVVCQVEAAEDARVIRVIDVSGTGDTKRFVTERFEKGEWGMPDAPYKHTKRDGRVFFVSQEFIDAGLKIDLPEIVKKLKIPALFIHGDADESVLYSEGQKLFSFYGGPKEFVTIAGANHSFTDPDRERQMIDAIIQWLKTAVNNRP